MKRKPGKWLALIMVSIMLALVMACASRAEAPAPPETTETLPLEVVDQLGRTVSIEKVPERIISLAPSNTEIVFALGLADKLVGATDYCDYPPEAAEKPSVGGFSTANIEEVIAKAERAISAELCGFEMARSSIAAG